MKRLSFPVEINAKEGTKEYSDEIFGKMGDIMKDLTKDFYAKPIVSFEFCKSNGFTFKVFRKELLSPRGYCTYRTLRYCKTKEEAVLLVAKYAQQEISK
jgi:hypothetical protein